MNSRTSTMTRRGRPEEEEEARPATSSWPPARRVSALPERGAVPVATRPRASSEGVFGTIVSFPACRQEE